VIIMKKYLFLAIAYLSSLAALGQPMMQNPGPDDTFSKIEGIKKTSAFRYNVPRIQDIHARAGFGPAFYVFPDQPLDADQALTLVNELQLPQLAKDFSGSLVVVNPMAKTYQKEDVEAFHELLNLQGGATNVKVIGLGNGATFVNQHLATSKLAGVIAGIVSINGNSGKAGSLKVPVYVGGSNATKVAKAYIAQNVAVKKEQLEGITFYHNADEPLLRVVVNSNKKTTQKDLIAEAWTLLLSRNYRYNNLYQTFYTARGIDNENGVEEFELEPYVMFDQLDIQRNVVEYAISGPNPANNQKYLWYEYIPKRLLNAPKSSVPLVLLLHGNANDPRTQSETSGFIELAAEEGFAVAELEWQGNANYSPMGLDGIEGVVYEILDKYPFLDPSRIYSEGLSAGSMTSSTLGVKKSHVFAAVGGHSGGLFSGRGLGYYGYGSEPIMNEAKQKRGHIEMPYCSVIGTDDEVVRFLNANDWKNNSILNAWNIYQTMNGIEVTPELDFSKDATFGITLRDRKQIITNKNGISMEFGQLYKGEIPIIRMIAINHYCHWNFKPTAKLMWDFFKHYSRDPETKALIYTK